MAGYVKPMLSFITSDHKSSICQGKKYIKCESQAFLHSDFAFINTSCVKLFSHVISSCHSRYRLQTCLFCSAFYFMSMWLIEAKQCARKQTKLLVMAVQIFLVHMKKYVIKQIVSSLCMTLMCFYLHNSTYPSHKAKYCVNKAMWWIWMYPLIDWHFVVNV